MKREQKFKVDKKFKSPYFDLQNSLQWHDAITFASRIIGLFPVITWFLSFNHNRIYKLWLMVNKVKFVRQAKYDEE